MTILIRNDDAKRLYAGAALAAAIGLAGGALMYPDLRGPEDAEGSQLVAGVSGVRGDPSVTAASWTSYQGTVPDFVYGTDYLRTPVAQYAEYADASDTGDVMAYEAPPEDAEPAAAYAVEEHASAAVHVGLSAEEAAREPVRYPSTSGGVPYEANLPAPPPPPVEDDAPIISG